MSETYADLVHNGGLLGERALRIEHERDALVVENIRLRAALEKIATDYYHDRHAIWAIEALRTHHDV